MIAQNRTNRPCNLRRRQHRQRNLVQQRLKRVIVLAVDHGNVDRQVGQSLCRMNAAKAASKDDDPLPHLPPNCQSSHNATLHKFNFWCKSQF